MFSYYSCSKDDIVTSEKALLKSKLWYHSINDMIPIVTSEYQYDNDKRLEKINHYKKNSDTLFKYESFYYNSDYKIETRLEYSYANDLFGWVLTDSSYYSYENDKLIYEKIYYPPPNSYQISYKYEYENSKIIKKYRYDNQQFVWCITYDYANDVCIKETRLADYNLTLIAGYIIHLYEEDFLIRSEKYTSQNQNFQVITYTYDVAGNLIIEESKETEFKVEAPLEYVYRYEYY